MRNKNTATILAFFTGFIGGHKFYLGEIGWGIIYLLFAGTSIPCLVGIIEGFLLMGMSRVDFDYKYNRRLIAAQDSRYLTNHPPINGNQTAQTNQTTQQAIAENVTVQQTSSGNAQKDLPLNDVLSVEHIDRQILKLCKAKGEMTLLDCFLELENIPKRILKARLENLVREEFLEISNRDTDGKIVYRLDN